MSESTFNGAKTAYLSCFSYINMLIEKEGIEQAFALMSQSDKPRGINVGKEIKAEAGGKDFTVKETLETITEMAKDIGGIDILLELTDAKAVTLTKFGNCPVYEAAKQIGMDDKTIEAMCRASSLVFLDNVVNQLNPKLRYSVSHFRSEEYGGCIEEIILDAL